MVDYPSPEEHLVARRHEPPAALPTKDGTPAEDISIFGRTNFSSGFAAKRYVFGIKRADRLRHIYLIGKSGAGKSKLMEQLIRSDVFFGHGVCVIDPSGDLVHSVMDFVPEDRVQDVVVIDPTDRDCPVTMNPIGGLTAEERMPMTNELIEIVKKQFAWVWSPRVEQVLRMATLAVLDLPGGNLRRIAMMLGETSERERIVPQIKDEIVRHFWQVEFPKRTTGYEAAVIGPLLNKFSQLLADPLTRHIFSQETNKIDFYQLMQERRIVLVNLAKRNLGDDVSAFLGAVLMARLKISAMRRMSLPEHMRYPFYLYVDEFQSVATKTFENLLMEGRRLGIAVTLANQSLWKLDDTLRVAIFGNIGTLVSFQISADDAKIIQDEMTPIFEVRDLINLAEREIYVKMTIDGRRYDPFSADVLAVTEPKHPSYAKKILEHSRARYCASRSDVEQTIREAPAAVTP